jgi:hypothetical protein
MNLKTKAIIDAFKKGYHFDKNDNVLSPKNKIRKLKIDKQGYPRFSLITYDKKHCEILVHRFKAYILYGDIIFKKELCVRHKNNNKLDYSNKNLILGTYSENSLDNPKKDRISRAKHAASFIRDRKSVV